MDVHYEGLLEPVQGRPDCQSVDRRNFVDWNINSGISGIRTFQRLFGLKDDGIVGKNTLAALNGQDPEEIFARIYEARKNFYRKIVMRAPDQGVNLAGWFNRLKHFKYNL